MPSKHTSSDEPGMGGVPRTPKTAELYGRLHEIIEAFQAGAISAAYYSKRHAVLTDKLSVVNSTSTVVDIPKAQGVEQASLK